MRLDYRLRFGDGVGLGLSTSKVEHTADKTFAPVVTHILRGSSVEGEKERRRFVLPKNTVPE